MRPLARASDASNQLLFLPSLFNETMALLFDAHHYFQSRGGAEHSAMPVAYQSIYANEMSRITIRLTSVMAWIMVRKAVTSGRIEEEKAAAQYRLEAGNVKADLPDGALDILPYHFWHLSERSRALYERVERLDALAYGDLPAYKRGVFH